LFHYRESALEYNVRPFESISSKKREPGPEGFGIFTDPDLVRRVRYVLS
jgi:hypothetical protein